MTLQKESEGKKVRGGKEFTPRIIRAEAPVYGGYVIGRDEKVVFMKGAIPGELLEVSIDEKKRDYAIASVKSIIEPSPFRRKPPCPIFGICGGCHLQFIGYDRQVYMKEEILLDALRRIGDIDVALMPSIIEREFGYRRRAQFKVSKNGSIGFYREGTREVVPVEECPLMVDEINVILQRLKAVDLKGVKEVHVSSGDTVTLLIKGEVTEETAQELLGTGVSGIAFENGDSMGKDYITLDLHGLKYTVTPWSFFQSHWSLNRIVVDTVINELAPLENSRVLDLYAGAGNFSIPVSSCAKEVVAVEENYYAVEDGRRNVMLNGIKNCNFVYMTVEESLKRRKSQRVSRLFDETHYDTIILDPPRTGLTSDSIRNILEKGSKRIVYLSCNPATLARDIKKMNEAYEIESVRMIDFFPNTYHIEALVFLKRK